jgi:hypothetical protein
MAVRVHIIILWLVALIGLISGYKTSGGICHYRLQGCSGQDEGADKTVFQKYYTDCMELQEMHSSAD